MLHTENVARGGQTESFQNEGGGEGAYNVLTFQKSRGARAHLGEANAPPPPRNETLQYCVMVNNTVNHTFLTVLYFSDLETTRN